MFKTNDGLPAITQLAHVTIKSRDHTHLTSVTMTKAIAPVAAEIMPGRPPAKAMMVAMLNEA